MSSVLIKNFQIINNSQQLAIDVETMVGYNITSIILWDINTFKDYSLAVNLDYKLTQINNEESFIVDAVELNLTSFKDIYFMEVRSNYTGDDTCISCLEPALGVTYNLNEYLRCMLNYLLKYEKESTCNNIDYFKNNITITINLLIDSVEKALDVGFYTQAIDMIKKLKKLCSISQCTNCENIACNKCSKFKQF